MAGAVEGLGTASRIYFDKPASALNLGEALALAVIPQNPVARFPAKAAGREALLTARERLFAHWRQRFGHSQTALLAPRFRSPAALPRRAPHFRSRSCAAERRAENPHHARFGYADAGGRAGCAITCVVVAPTAIRNAAALLLDHDAAQVLALVGSAGFFDDAIAGQVNGVRAPAFPRLDLEAASLRARAGRRAAPPPCLCRRTRRAVSPASRRRTSTAGFSARCSPATRSSTAATCRPSTRWPGSAWAAFATGWPAPALHVWAKPTTTAWRWRSAAPR